MLIETLVWATSTCIPAARKAGLVSEVAAIAGRHKRHKSLWGHHLTHTKSFIEKHLSLVDPNKPILILGSGLCLDIPLSALNKHAAGVVLMDAVQPLATRIACIGFANIQFCYADITGFLRPFWNSKEGAKITPPPIAPINLNHYGMVISCNLLSQLPLSFAHSPPTDETERRLTASIQLAHMKALTSLSCPALLITDYERLESEAGSTNNIPTISPRLVPREPEETWQWHIAPKGDIRPGLDIKLNVGGWLLSS